MKVNITSLLVIIAVFVFVSFQIERTTGYDVFYGPYDNLLLRSILAILAMVLYSYFMLDLFANEVPKRVALRNTILLGFLSWFLYKSPQLLDYASRDWKGPAGMNPIILIEWMQLIVIPILVAVFYSRRYGFKADRKKS